MERTRGSLIALYHKIQEVKSKTTSYFAGLTIYSMGTIE